MESILNCFGNIIGTKPEDVTQPTPTPIPALTSDSGLYITDLEAVETIRALIEDNIEIDLDTDLENKLLSARRVAILKLHTDLTALMMRYAKPRQSFSGNIGAKKFTTPIIETGKSGIRLVCRPIKDAELIIRGLVTVFSEAGAISVYIANNYNDEVIEIENILTVQNKVKVNNLTDSITLPLFHEDADGCVEYYIYHENDLKPNNNKIFCSSCRTWRFNSEAPSWKMYGSEQYLHYAGFNGEPGQLGTTGQNTTKGLQLKADVVCRTDRSICSGSINFNTDPMAMAYATAIQYFAGSIVVWDVIRTPKLNRVLMQDMESLKDAASYYGRKYNDMIRYISKNMIIQSDCFCEKGFTNAKIAHPY